MSRKVNYRKQTYVRKITARIKRSEIVRSPGPKHQFKPVVQMLTLRIQIQMTKLGKIQLREHTWLAGTFLKILQRLKAGSKLCTKEPIFLSVFKQLITMSSAKKKSNKILPSSGFVVERSMNAAL